MPEYAWAAGFFDGEGSTTTRAAKPGGKLYLRVGVQQKDRRVLDKWVRIFGGNVVGPHVNGIYGVWHHGAKVLGVMGAMWPHLSEAKREQWFRAAGRL